MTGDLLWLEPVGGLAGDMFLAAALDLGLPRDALEAALAGLGLPGFRLEVTRRESSGIAGTHLDVRVEGAQPSVRGLSEILALVGASGLSPRAKEAAAAVFRRLGAAEAKVHGVPVEQVHFHEVGAVDSIVDVCGAAAVLELLGWPRVIASPPELGKGMVKTAHGFLPVPPPAVLELVRGLPVRPGGPPGEAVTPTGAALLATLCEVGEPPPLVARAVGYGVGTARWPDRPNVLRMTLADAAPGAAAGAPAGEVWELACNLDDATGQLAARAVDEALARGALDAWVAPVTMKKGRPGLVLSALAPAAARDEVARALVRETTTLGVRMRPVSRLELAREWREVETMYGAVRVKLGLLDGAVVQAQPEHDDCLARARERGVPLKEVLAAALAAWRSGRA
ncbi:nickel pincer cofactor biosynthesis protein LarC [Anaeromyxobacter paludicola]|uniref:Putative nickel insertion protein n=1 Tax=Anaeromyxobacter paludicola TaxID=2918171 RepID=A0ABN6N8X7_9BACT|nr:nickel pincer cofactor biosynthesis protein LarC [Anaeromyxobacter paludicola]BDG09672.1 UPF0272 protein [Anaeromyxobacter paludicola]